jgi:hypothetical protein
LEVVDVPKGNVARKDAPNYYRILRDEIRESEFI